MVKPLCSFTVCQVVTLRDVGFSWSKIKKLLNYKSGSSEQYAYKRYLKNNFRGPKIVRKTPVVVQKSEKSSHSGLKDPKISLERISVAHNAFSCCDEISRRTVYPNLIFFNFKKSRSISSKNFCRWRCALLFHH